MRSLLIMLDANIPIYNYKLFGYADKQIAETWTSALWEASRNFLDYSWMPQNYIGC